MDQLENKIGFLPGLSSFRKKSEPDRTRNEKGKAGPESDGQHRPRRISAAAQNHITAMCAEFVGTFLFLFFAFSGTQVANTPRSNSGNQTTALPQGPDPSQLMYISLVFAFSLTVNAWVFFRVSGGLFNPAVTLALCMVGAVPWVRGALVFIAQMLGAMASAGVVLGLFPGPLAVTTTLGATTSTAQGLFIEMFLTAMLILTILMLAVEKHKATFIAPVGIGLALFIAELSGVYFTGGSLNPARSFGPCVATRSFPSEHWIYWLGPVLGAVLAAGFYAFIKAQDYEAVNPGQDFDDLEASAYNPDEDLSRPVVSPNAMVDRSNSQDLAQMMSEDGRRSKDSSGRRPTSSNSGFFSSNRVRGNTNGSANAHDRTTVPTTGRTMHIGGGQ